MEDKTKVEGAGALSEIFKLLFKGVDRIFDQAVEYENDFGKLKQVTKLPIKYKNKDYVVEVKLAPVKGKEDIFYVEIDDGGSGLDFSKYNEKPMKIEDKTNRKEFEDRIKQIINDAGAQIESQDDNEESEEGKGDKNIIQCYDVNDYMEWEETEQQGPEPRIIDVIEYKSPADTKGNLNITLECSDRELKPSDNRLLDDVLTNVPPSQVDGIILDILKTSKLITVKSSKEESEEDELVDTYMEEGTPASSHLDVSLSYIKSSDEVNLSAIYANYDVGQAMEALQQVIDNDEFVATLTEEPQSFRITDEGDDYDVTIIDEVDTSNSACDIYTAICALSGMLDAYSINLDTQQQAAAAELATALAKAQAVFTPTDKLDPL